MNFKQRCKTLTAELGRSPFFPLLFIGEGTKQTVYHLVTGSPGTDILGASWVMAALSAIAWLFFYEEVAWGIQVAAETADDVADD